MKRANPISEIAGRPTVFDEPWQARAFAMAVSLQDSGLFDTIEWAETLGRHIRLAQEADDPDDGSAYYSHWLAALEDVLYSREIVSAGVVDEFTHAWQNAATRTPHGKPIELETEDFDHADHAD